MTSTVVLLALAFGFIAGLFYTKALAKNAGADPFTQHSVATVSALIWPVIVLTALYTRWKDRKVLTPDAQDMP